MGLETVAILGLAASLYSEFVFFFQEGLSYSKALPETSKDVSSILIFSTAFSQNKKNHSLNGTVFYSYILQALVLGML